MSLTKQNGTDVMFPSFSNLLEEFMADALPATQLHKSVPAVNIQETENEFLLEVAAPGLSKEHFNLHIEQKRLTISASAEENRAKGKYARREFNYTSFRRVFALPDFVNTEHIHATYENGLLKIVVPKREEVKPRTIQIS